VQIVAKKQKQHFVGDAGQAWLGKMKIDSISLSLLPKI
jgi:hypothetical protein